MSQESYEAFRQMFPSNELLCGLFGVVDYNDLFEQHFAQAAELIHKGEVLGVYPSDVAIADALESGELSRKGKGKKAVLELDKELYRKSHDLFATVRHTFHSMFIVSPILQLRNQDRAPEWSGTAKPVYVFEDGRYGDAVFAHYPNTIDPADQVLCGKLCHELIAALQKHPQETDVWWEFKIEGDSVWLQPKELTDDLKAAMQKEYDEERARTRFVMLPFYPRWNPDRSKEPKSDWTPATVTRIFDFD